MTRDPGVANPAAAIEGIADKVAEGVIDSSEVILRCGQLAADLEHVEADVLITRVAWELEARDGLDYEAESIQRNLIPPVRTVGRYYPSRDYTSPEVGDRVIHHIGDSLAVAEVVGVPGTTAGEAEITASGLTIADARDCSPSEPVVEGRHVREFGDELDGPTYRVALSRLGKKIDDENGDETAADRIPESEISDQVDRMMETNDLEYENEE